MSFFVGAGLAPALTANKAARMFEDVDKILHVSGVTGRGQAPPLQTPGLLVSLASRLKILRYIKGMSKKSLNLHLKDE